MKTMKRLTSLMLVLIMAMSMVVTNGSVEAKAASNYATIAVEKFTIGQGYYMEPTRVAVKSGDTVYDVIKANVKGAQLAESSYGGYYLKSITGAKNGAIKLPKCIQNMNITDYLGNKVDIKYNEKDNPYTNNGIGELSFTGTAGWMFSKNEIAPDKGMSDVEVENGDVIRVQFTMYGYGSDIGLGWDPASNLSLPNRNEITKSLATMKATAGMSQTSAYKAAVKTAGNLDSTKADIDKASKSVKDSLYNRSHPKMTLNATKASFNATKSKTIYGKTFNNEGDTITKAVSSNKSVASVSVKGGKATVKGLKKGTATITFTSKYGAKSTAKVTVNASVKMKKSTVTVKKGKKVKVYIKSKTVSTDKIASAKSANKKKATVKKYSKYVKITGKKKGKTTIVVTSKYGATAKITVKVK